MNRSKVIANKVGVMYLDKAKSETELKILSEQANAWLSDEKVIKTLRRLKEISSMPHEGLISSWHKHGTQFGKSLGLDKTDICYIVDNLPSVVVSQALSLKFGNAIYECIEKGMVVDEV